MMKMATASAALFGFMVSGCNGYVKDETLPMPLVSIHYSVIDGSTNQARNHAGKYTVTFRPNAGTDETDTVEVQEVLKSKDGVYSVPTVQISTWCSKDKKSPEAQEVCHKMAIVTGVSGF